MFRTMKDRKGTLRCRSVTTRKPCGGLLLEQLEDRTLMDAGMLDPTFGSGGRVTTNFTGSLDNTAEAVALQPDGKLVVAGSVTSAGTASLALARYNADGSLDSTFGGGRITGGAGEAAGVAVQPDGKLVVAGRLNADFVVARFNPDGSVDQSFGTGGQVVTDFEGRIDRAQALALQPDGKIVVLGTSVLGLSSTSAFALARYTATGAPDPLFGSGGTVLTSFSVPESPSSLTGNGSGLLLQPDGKLVAVGSGHIRFVAARYHADGSLDASFGSGGKVTTRLTRPGIAAAGARQTDGKLVVAVSTSIGPSDTGSPLIRLVALARYHPDGSLDSTFGTGGIYEEPLPLSSRLDQARGIAILPDGKILVGGQQSGVTARSDFYLKRYTASGAPETVTLTDFGSADGATGLVVLADGRAVLAGTTGSDFALARYTAALELDAAFGVGGKVVTDFIGPLDARVRGLVVLADGKLVAAGTAGSDFALARYLADGRLDVSFGSGGQVLTDIAGTVDILGGVALQADGKIVVAGAASGKFGLARYKPDGTLDTTFGTGGKVLYQPTISIDRPELSVEGLVVQPDGKLVVLGEKGATGSRSTPVTVLALARFNPDGSPDAAFSDRPINTGEQRVQGIALRSDGKLLVIGTSRAGLKLTRVDPQWGLDAGFNLQGWRSLLSNLSVRRSAGIALMPDGRILVAASTTPDAGGDFLLARLHANGNLDTSFGNAGTVSTDFGGEDAAGGLLLQADGRIVLVGGTSAEGGAFATARYDPNGALDASFGRNGKVTTAFAGGAAAGVARQADGKLVVAGGAPAAGARRDFALTRYTADNRAANPNERYVAQLYLALLQRTADPGGLGYFTSILDRGLATRGQVALALEVSTEYRALTVQALYGQILNRKGEPAGVNFFVGFLNAGGTLPQVRATMFGSAEYYQTRAGSTTSGLLAALFRDALDRAIDDNGREAYGRTLAAGASPQAVAGAVLTSTEATQNQVQALYRALLRRDADGGGLSAFASFLQAGGREETVLAALLSSAEFAAGL